jgi:hypothetical protein
MRGLANRRYFSFLVILSMVTGLGAHSAWAQSSPSTLPANWRQLSPTDFASLVQGYFQQGTFQSLSRADQTSLQSQGGQLFSQVDISSTSLSYQTLEALAHVGESQLDQSTLAGANKAIMARRDNWTGKPYAEMFAKVKLMARLQVPETISNIEARKWVLAGGTPDQVPQNDLVYNYVRHMFADFEVIDGNFSVSWVGQVNAPQSGDYTFSITPIDVNMGYSQTWARMSMSVTVAGQEMITAGPPAPPDPNTANYQVGTKPTSNWVVESNPIALTAGTPVKLQVVVSVKTPQTLPPGTLHAMLFWQGPGIPRQLVPTSAVSQPQTGAPGFQASYSWTSNGQQQNLNRTDPVIDFSWTGASILLAQDPTSANQSSDSMWQTMTSSSFISSLASTTPLKLHPFLQEPQEASCGLSSARRQAFCDLLVQNPALLDGMDADHAVRFFKVFRGGATDKALNVFGSWAARQADMACVLSNERAFDADTRQALASMAILTTQQLPHQATTLQQGFLQLPDGRCSLPVAYTLMYSQLGLGKLNDWIASLDAKLADPTVTGDLRVNWLLARAQAQEFTRRAPMHYPFGFDYPSSWPNDGRAYLYQALAAAQSPSSKLRAAREIAARLTSSHLYQPAKDLLAQLAGSLPEAERSVITAWQQEIDAFVAADVLAIAAQQSESNRLYLKTLQDRRAQAASQGNSDAVSRYDALISTASNRH